jgi:hypothetical protein
MPRPDLPPLPAPAGCELSLAQSPKMRCPLGTDRGSIFATVILPGAMPKTILFITHEVDEALILSERIYVMTTGPGCFLGEITVDLPRPRTLEVMATPTFLTIKRRLVNLLERAGFGERVLVLI